MAVLGASSLYCGCVSVPAVVSSELSACSFTDLVRKARPSASSMQPVVLLDKTTKASLTSTVQITTVRMDDQLPTASHLRCGAIYTVCLCVCALIMVCGIISLQVCVCMRVCVIGR